MLPFLTYSSCLTLWRRMYPPRYKSSEWNILIISVAVFMPDMYSYSPLHYLSNCATIRPSSCMLMEKTVAKFKLVSETRGESPRRRFSRNKKTASVDYMYIYDFYKKIGLGFMGPCTPLDWSRGSILKKNWTTGFHRFLQVFFKSLRKKLSPTPSLSSVSIF